MKMNLLEWISFNNLEVTLNVLDCDKPKYRLEFRSKNGDVLFIFTCTKKELRELKQELDYLLDDE